MISASAFHAVRIDFRGVRLKLKKFAAGYELSFHGVRIALKSKVSPRVFSRNSVFALISRQLGIETESEMRAKFREVRIKNNKKSVKYELIVMGCEMDCRGVRIPAPACLSMENEKQFFGWMSLSIGKILPRCRILFNRYFR